jgi:antirestriction protein ArdC
VERIANVDKFLNGTSATIHHGGDRAFFQRSTDRIQLVHWSGASTASIARWGKRFGDQAYAAEELVAEIGAAFLCAELGITEDTRPDHAQYLAQWLKLLKGDSRAIFTAAAKASEAAKFLTRDH